MPVTTRAAKRKTDLRTMAAIKEFNRREEDIPLTPINRLYMEQALAAPPALFPILAGGNPPPSRSQLEAWLRPPTSVAQQEAMVSLAMERRGDARQRRRRVRRRPVARPRPRARARPRARRR